MKNWKCIIGLHDDEVLGTQTVTNIAGGFSMVPLMRIVEKCKRCGLKHYVGLDISTDAHLDNTLNWTPEL